MKKIFIIAVLCTLFDQIIKLIFTFNMNMGDSITIIPNFWSFTLVGNTGAAFSILSNNTFLLIIVSFIVLNLIYFFLIKGKYLSSHEQTAYGLLIGGILGNLIDRILYGYVIDYMDFNFFGYSFPVFNLADMLIIGAMIFIVIDVLKGDKNAVNSNAKGK